jgi:hypothetical protein
MAMTQFDDDDVAPTASSAHIAVGKTTRAIPRSIHGTDPQSLSLVSFSRPPPSESLSNESR